MTYANGDVYHGEWEQDAKVSGSDSDSEEILRDIENQHYLYIL